MTLLDLSSTRAWTVHWRLKLPADFWVGTFFAAVGAVAIEQGASLRQGTAGNMGPGFVPLWLGVGLVAVGVLIALGALRARIRKSRSAQDIVSPGATHVVRPIAVTTLALLTFSVTLDHWGLFLASGLLVAVARLEAWIKRPLEIMALSGALALVNVAVFHWGLGMPVAIWPS